MNTTRRPKRTVPFLVLAAAIVALLAGCSPAVTAGRDGSAPVGPVSRPGGLRPNTATGTSSPRPAVRTTAPVHVKLLTLDGSTYGVGMPVVALFSQRITDAKSFQAATTATVDGKPIRVAWYFQNSAYEQGYPIEAHLRPQGYWPAHAHIHVDLPVRGLPAGDGMAFDDSLTSDWHTGAKTISVVDNRTHTITVTSDDKAYGTFPISLGEDNATMRTYSGIKVIMEQVPTVCMHDTQGSYHDCGIKWDQRVTYTGEYLHAAPWNCSPARGHGCTGPGNDIGSGNSSNGCTNLMPTDAANLYRFMRVGDVVTYPNADGPTLPMGDGYSDWNLTWTQWLTGGLLATT